MKRLCQSSGSQRAFDAETRDLDTALKTGLNSLSRYAALPFGGPTRLNEPTALLELEDKFNLLLKRERGQTAAMRFLCFY